MKRSATTKYPGVSRVWPLLVWYYCELCKEEFTRMVGWQLYTPFFRYNLYLCLDCSPTKKVAGEQFKIIFEEKLEERRRNRPSPPPGPSSRLRKEGEQVSREKLPSR